MEEYIRCKDCGARLAQPEDKGQLLCDQCKPLRIVKEKWKPFTSGSYIQSVFHVPDYGDAPRREPRKWPQ